MLQQFVENTTCASSIHPSLSWTLTRNPSSHSSSRNSVRIRWRLQARFCSPLGTGCVVGRAGFAVEEDPLKKVGGRQVEGAAWGPHSEGDHLEEEEVHREGSEEGTSPLGVEGPTLEAKQRKHRVKFMLVKPGDKMLCAMERAATY